MTSISSSRSGMTLVELVLTVAILSILMAAVSASYETIQARVRCSEVKANMDAIAQAAYTDYSYNGYWADTPADIGTMPQVFRDEGLLNKWPRPPCPGMFFAWENWNAFGYTAARVVLYRENITALWSYCVDVAGGGTCSIPGDPTIGNPVEISTAPVHYLYCNE